MINYVDYNDPQNLPDYDNFCHIFQQNPPKKIIKHDFSKDLKNLLSEKLPNDKKVYRPWLVYSTIKGFCNKLFNKNWYSTLKKSKDWKNIGSIIFSHEKNTFHSNNFQTWKELCYVRVIKEKTII